VEPTSNETERNEVKKKKKVLRCTTDFDRNSSHFAKLCDTIDAFYYRYSYFIPILTEERDLFREFSVTVLDVSIESKSPRI